MPQFESADEFPEKGDISSPVLRDEIMAIVSEIIEKQRFVLIEDLIARARRNIGAERIAIENAIDHLIKDKIIVPGSRITTKIILHNPTRRQIYMILKQNPGLNVNSIKKTLNLGSNSVLWHLSVLLKFGCIQRINYKASFLYALPKLSAIEVLFQFVIRKKIVREIFMYLRTQALSIASLEEKLGVDRANISYTLKILQDLTFIQKHPQENANGESTFQISPFIISLYEQFQKLP
jgi:predicted transcriptional regulator